MPRIPIYQGRVRRPVTQPAQIPLGFMAGPALELERAGKEVARFGQQLVEAHRSTMYAKHISESAGELQNLALEFEQDPEIWDIEERAQKAVEAFKTSKLKEIRDPILLKQFGFAFDKMAAPKLASMISSARKRQNDYNKAATLSSIDALERAYHAATNQAEAAQIISQMKGIISGQAQAGVLGFTEAEKIWQSKVSDMAGTEVRKDIWENPREAHADLIANKYAGLTDEDRIKYIEMAERRIEAEDRDDLRLLKEQERQEAKELKERREQTGLTMDQMMADGELTRRWLDQQVAWRNLDEGQYKAGLRWLQDGGGNVDDHTTVNRLTDKILAGEDASGEISDAYTRGSLRFDTQLTMKKANVSRQRQEDQTAEGRALNWLLGKLDIPTGEMAPLSADESARAADAKLLFWLKVEQGIEPQPAAREVLERIQPIIAIPLMRLPCPRYGKAAIKNSQDLADAVSWLMGQIQAGMSKGEVAYWHDILTRYQKIDERYGIEDLLSGIKEREKTREQSIQKGMEERGMKRKKTRELK